MEKYSDIVILCVGTSRLIGDSVGPVVGQKLTRLLEEKENVKIYGTTKRNLNLKNAKQILEEINSIYQNPFIITIDAALGPKELVEMVFVGTGKVQIGKALGQSMEYFSHLIMKGIVGENKENLKENKEILKKVKQNQVQRLSNQIAYEVCQMVETINFV